MSNLFFYGTLRHAPLLELVMGQTAGKLSANPAILADHAVYSVKGQPFPMIVAEKGATADGVLVQGLGKDELARLAFYEGGFEYDLRQQTIETSEDGNHQALVFFPESEAWKTDTLWDFEAWKNDWSALSMLAAQEVMAQYGCVDASTISNSFPAIRIRAWARLAARQRSTGDARDTNYDVVIHQRNHPYVNYFGIDEIELQHRQYDGKMGPVLHRSGLMQGSAVIVLPYDPRRDTVLLVEQFRAPVFLIDDPEPWMWEPVAGMIDPGETPEQAAYRETQEEAHVSLSRLEYAGGAYTSSGSSTEYVYLYVGLGDLTTTVESGGLATEGEDIRSKILPFDEFMYMVDTHVFKDLPLLSLAHWLARNRERLRA
ncbi:NUDIX domain-containing protein [Ruegeria conchae]|uniref:NUDIX domain-containing protein n=1 Tax=Ruegeria conchae TaxID=981384 RepID=UPI0021A90298|nr:NUDIX domain-containing protein [Ruegeria conchae]UWR04495.1 NUDIX domain-containing protein [Ruegeria conchae]